MQIPDGRTLLVIALLLASSTAVGAVAGYRLYVQEVLVPEAPPINVTVAVHWPDDTNTTSALVIAGMERNAFDALVLLSEVHGFGMHHRFYGDDVYVYAIGDHAAEGRCGWVYSVDGMGIQYQPQHAANHEVLYEGQTLAWSWACV